LAGHQSGSQTIVNKRKKQEPINVIFMRKLGRIYSADVSAKYLLVLLIFAIVFAVVAVLIINRYVDLYFENRELHNKTARLSRLVEEYKFQSQVSAQYNRLARELNQTEEKKPLSDQGGETQASKEETVKEEPRTGESIVRPDLKTPENPPVDAVNFSVKPEKNNTALSFQFELQNIHPGNRNISGYIVVVLVNDRTDPPRLAVYPDVEFKNGVPVDYKKGTQFSISYGKIVQGQVDKLENAQDFNQAWVFIYNDQGKLLQYKLLKK